MHKLIATCGLLAALLAGAAWSADGDDEPRGKDAVRAFMRGKLDASSDVLEGLTTERFDLIADGADRMRLMSKKAAWNSIKTDQYVQYSQEFQRTTEQLAKAAREKKLDAAALAWTQVTLNCINCHRYARDTMVTWNEATDLATLMAVASPLEEK